MRPHIHMQLEKLHCEHLQAWIAEHADTSALVPAVRESLLSDKLSVPELLAVAFLANEGLVLFKPTASSEMLQCSAGVDVKGEKKTEYEAVFKHVEAIEPIESPKSAAPTQSAEPTKSVSETPEKKADKVDTLDKLMAQFELEDEELAPSWLTN